MDNVIIAIVWFLIPAVILFFVVHHSTRSNTGRPRRIGIKDLTLACLVIAAGYAGIISILAMPKSLLGLTSATAEFAFKIIAGVILVIIGLPFKGVTRMFLMIMGVIVLFAALPYVFTNLGSVGAFVLIALAMVGLVVATVIMSQREKKNG